MEYLKILENTNLLVSETNLSRLLPCLEKKNLVEPHMFELYKNDNINENYRKAGLFINIFSSCSKEVYDNFLEALKDSGHSDLLHKLNVETTCGSLEKLEINKKEETHIAQINASTIKHAKPFQMPSENIPPNVVLSNDAHMQGASDNANDKIKPLKVKVIKSMRFYDDPKSTELPIYTTRSANRGAVLMINNMKFINDILQYREGAEEDENNLKSLFKQCGLKIQSHNDKNANEMHDILHKFSKCEKTLRGVDMVVIVIMSHGQEGHSHKDSFVMGVDRTTISVHEIIDMFNNDNCPMLQKIPKIFIFQNCRGDKRDYGTPAFRLNKVRTTTDNSNHLNYNHRLSTYSDILIAQSTQPGYVSHRDIYSGTWYIQTLCKIFMNHAHNTHIEDLLKMVSAEVQNVRSENGTMQTPYYENIAFNICYLHPGLYK